MQSLEHDYCRQAVTPRSPLPQQREANRDSLIRGVVSRPGGAKGKCLVGGHGDRFAIVPLFSS